MAPRNYERFASSAAASTSRSDASASSESGTTPAATVTQHSKHPHQPQITHPVPACRSPRPSWTPTPHHTNSEYLHLADGDDQAGNGHYYSRHDEPQPTWLRDSGEVGPGASSGPLLLRGGLHRVPGLRGRGRAWLFRGKRLNEEFRFRRFRVLALACWRGRSRRVAGCGRLPRAWDRTCTGAS